MARPRFALMQQCRATRDVADGVRSRSSPSRPPAVVNEPTSTYGDLANDGRLRRAGPGDLTNPQDQPISLPCFAKCNNAAAPGFHGAPVYMVYSSTLVAAV